MFSLADVPRENSERAKRAKSSLSVSLDRCLAQRIRPAQRPAERSRSAAGGIWSLRYQPAAKTDSPFLLITAWELARFVPVYPSGSCAIAVGSCAIAADHQCKRKLSPAGTLNSLRFMRDSGGPRHKLLRHVLATGGCAQQHRRHAAAVRGDVTGRVRVALGVQPEDGAARGCSRSGTRLPYSAP